MRSTALGYSQRGEDQEGDREDSWPAFPRVPRAPRQTSPSVGLDRRDRLALVFVVVCVVLFGLPAFLIVVLDALPLVGDWLTVHVPFWDEVTDFYDWLSSNAS